MNILAIESSSKALSVAVARCGRLKSELASTKTFKNEHIINFIKKALAKARLSLSDIDYIAVGLGPGSFTGLRVGLATAQGLSLALKVKIIGIGSLDILAAGIEGRYKADICTIVDAKRSSVYACIFKNRNSGSSSLPDKKMKYSLLGYRQLTDKLKGAIVFVGDGLPLCENIIRTNTAIKPVFARPDFWYPKAGVLALMAQELIASNKIGDKIILPIYLYPKECQVKNEK
jgi:tRNA threonylcarbamoyladenosine biosynthesis protein TsaB